jgi:DNA-binding response OmpR family regulator
MDRPLVLVVDDDPSIIALLTGLLEASGYAVRGAIDPLQGLMLAQREQPGLIVLDVRMPAGGGLKLLERLGVNARTKDIPVLVITACNDPHLEEYVRRRGAIGFLHKPLAPPALLAAVGALVRPSAGAAQAGPPALASGAV